MQLFWLMLLVAASSLSLKSSSLACIQLISLIHALDLSRMHALDLSLMHAPHLSLIVVHLSLISVRMLTYADVCIRLSAYVSIRTSLISVCGYVSRCSLSCILISCAVCKARALD